MKSARYLFVPLLSTTLLLQSCTTLTTSLAGFGLKSVVEVRHSRESPEMYYALGRFYLAQSRYDEAAKAYERALALKSDYEEAASALATAYAMQGRYDLAIAKLQAAIERSPQAAYLHNNLGYVYYMQRRYNEAIDALQTALRLERANAFALRNLVLVQAALGGGDKSSAAVAHAGASTPGAAPESTRVPPAPQATGEVQQTSPLRPQTAASGTSETTHANISIVPLAPSIYELREPPQVPSTAPVSGPSLVKDTTPIKAFRLEVSNSNGTTGMARRVAAALKREGMNPVRLTNQRPWQHGTEIQYSEGYALEGAALSHMLGQEAVLIRNDRLRRDINVRLVLGKDVRDETAFVSPREGSGMMAAVNAWTGELAPSGWTEFRIR